MVFNRGIGVELAIFDLDNTLLAADSDYLWGQYLGDQGLVDRDSYQRENHRFYEEYKAGTLDIYEFLRFSLQPLRDHPLASMQAHRQRFIEQDIAPVVAPMTPELLQRHRDAGRLCLIITATNRFVTEPIAHMLGVDELIATDPEMRDGAYTGEVDGVPCFQAGKVRRLGDWLRQRGLNLAGSWFYSDSHNDLPLLEQVSHPVAVDPDPTLEDHARALGWPVISLRGEALPAHGL